MAWSSAANEMIQPLIAPSYVIFGKLSDWAPDQPGLKLEECQAQDSTIQWGRIFSQKSKLNKTETQNSFFFIKYKKREMFKIFKNASRNEFNIILENFYQK